MRSASLVLSLLSEIIQRWKIFTTYLKHSEKKNKEVILLQRTNNKIIHVDVKRLLKLYEITSVTRE